MRFNNLEIKKPEPFDSGLKFLRDDIFLSPQSGIPPFGGKKMSSLNTFYL
jgi:hypothetical protein